MLRHMETITPNSLRAARAFLGWTTRDLEQHSGVGRRTINEIESRDDPTVDPAKVRTVRPATVEKIVATFAAHGLAFMPPPSDGVVRIPRS